MSAELSKHLERAKRCLERNRLDEAIVAYEAALEVAPGNMEALQALGDLHERLGDRGHSALYYGMLFDRLTDPHDEPKALALYSHFLKPLQQPSERVARYAGLLEKQNKTVEAIEQYAIAAQLFQDRRKGEGALTCLERIATLDPENAERQLGLAELAERMGKDDLAAWGFLRAGRLAVATGDLYRAIELCQRAHRLAPLNPGVALVYARARLGQGDAGAAVELLKPFAAAETGVEFRGTLGEALMRTGELDRARPLLEEFCRQKPGSCEILLELVDRYVKAKQDEQAVQVLAPLKQWMLEAHRENEFAAQLERLAEANPASIPLIEFWAALYNELNREAKYYDVLLRLFDLYFEAGNLKGACEALDRLVDIDPYDYRNQQRIERLQGRVDPAYLRGVTARLAQAASQVYKPRLLERTLMEESTASVPHEEQAFGDLEDLLVQTEIFLQYSLQDRAKERLKKIAERFPGEEEHNERLRRLYEQSGWWPPGSRRPEVAPEEAPAASPASFGAETVRDLAKISEINHAIYRQSSARAMLSAAVNEVGSYLRATRCLAVVGGPSKPPQMAAEFCSPGVEASPGGQIIRVLANLEQALADTLGGLRLDSSMSPVLKEMGLHSVLAVQLIDRETHAPAGMLAVGYGTPHKWQPNETYFLQAVGDQLLLSVSHTRMRTLVRNLVVPDEKTGLLGRSSYQDCLLAETHRAKTQGSPLALAILQLDHGLELVHQQGEAQVERHMEQVARALQTVVRQNDVAVKYTAWSLAFILPDTTQSGAQSLADKLRKTAAGVRPPWNGTPATLSAVVAEAITRADYDNEDIVTELINRAEASLEEARRRGGDTLVSLELPRS